MAGSADGPSGPPHRQQPGYLAAKRRSAFTESLIKNLPGGYPPSSGTGMVDQPVRNLWPFSARVMTSVHGRIIGSFRPGRFEPVAVAQADEAGVVRRIGGPISAAAIPDIASANAGRSRPAR